MKRILGIFGKDVRRLWPLALLFWVMLGVAAAIAPLPDYQSAPSFLHELPVLLTPVVCCLLVVCAIHGESLIGHEQYWLTRPYSWKHLMAAKGLLLVVFVNLPLLVCQLATLAALGISPLVWLPALLWRQVFFTTFFVLSTAAVAAVTRNLAQVVVAGFLLCATVLAGLSFFAMLLIGGGWDRWPYWSGLEWIRDCGLALVVITGTALVLVLQYSRRKTALSRAVLAGTVVAAIDRKSVV
jgi:hypothetical protein